MRPWEIIQKLESDNSRLFKESVVRDNIVSKEFTIGLQYALDSLVTFGVQQVPFSETDGKGLLDKEFFAVADKLVARELTGHAARDAIQELCDTATNEQWNDWYRRILIKDLRCGVSEKTVNNVAPKTVPVFGCMLAHDGAKHPKKIKGECIIEYKYDGVRVIAIVQNGSATLYSRNGKLLSNFPHIEEALSKPEYNDTVFDGEVMSDDFQTLMKQVHRKEGAQTQDAYLALFDVLSLDEFQEGEGSQDAMSRKLALEEYRDKEDCIKVVDYWVVNFDKPEGQELFDHLNKTALEKGYEGLMIKPTFDIYKCKRSHAWLKVKPFIEVTLSVIDVEEGTGRNVGKLGALIVEGEDDGKFFHVNVGSGLTDENREVFWANKEQLIGQLVEVRADAATISQDSDDIWSLRFPRFKTFRGFEPGEKL